MLLGLREQGTEMPDEYVRAATPFGGGIGLSKNVCGCLTAATMAVGRVYGTLEPTGTAPGPAYARINAVLNRFRERFGSTQCGDLTRSWQDDFAHRDRVAQCSRQVRFTLEQLREVLQRREEDPSWREGWWQDYLTRRDKVR